MLRRTNNSDNKLWQRLCLLGKTITKQCVGDSHGDLREKIGPKNRRLGTMHKYVPTVADCEKAVCRQEMEGGYGVKIEEQKTIQFDENSYADYQTEQVVIEYAREFK